MIEPTWFAAGAVLIGAFVSIFSPANTLCPVNLSPSQRAYIAGALGAAQAALQAIVGGQPIGQAIATAGLTVIAVIFNHGQSTADTKELAK